MNNKQPTPETSAYSSNSPNTMAWLSFAQKLERERDEARKELKKIKRELKRAIDAVHAINAIRCFWQAKWKEATKQTP